MELLEVCPTAREVRRFTGYGILCHLRAHGAKKLQINNNLVCSFQQFVEGFCLVNLPTG